jgi:hypothetical protein
MTRNLEKFLIFEVNWTKPYIKATSPRLLTSAWNGMPCVNRHALLQSHLEQLLTSNDQQVLERRIAPTWNPFHICVGLRINDMGIGNVWQHISNLARSLRLIFAICHVPLALFSALHPTLLRMAAGWFRVGYLRVSVLAGSGLEIIFYAQFFRVGPWNLTGLISGLVFHRWISKINH